MSRMKERTSYLQFTVKSLTLVNLWPPETKNYCTFFKKYYIAIIIIFTTFPILVDLVTQFQEQSVSFTNIIENLVALSAVYGVIYVLICFFSREEEIKILVEDLAVFEDYTPRALIDESEKNAQFYTKFFIAYGIIGNICYGLLPFINYTQCEKNKSYHMRNFGIPCGLVIRMVLPFKFDFSPVYELVAIEQVAVCTACTTIIIMVTMLISGLLIHITTHLKYLKSLILDLSPVLDNEILEEKIKFCVKFHTSIVDYAARVDASFSQMMLLHITWTGFIISVLGFEITATSDLVEALRFVMHLIGWLGMLFIICYYGQTLMDESLAISVAIYSFTWYEKSVQVQKYVLLMLLRSQKALTLKASGIKIMSLATFLGVLYSAYSYFTLLLKLKPQ